MACTVEVRDGRTIYHFHRRPFSLTRRAVERRVQHRLVAKSMVLRKCSRLSRRRDQLGDYFIVSIPDGGILTTHQKLEDVAFQLGVIGNEDVLPDE